MIQVIIYCGNNFFSFLVLNTKNWGWISFFNRLPIYNSSRKICYQKISELCSNFNNMSDKSKFYYLFTNEDLSIINIFGKRTSALRQENWNRVYDTEIFSFFLFLLLICLRLWTRQETLYLYIYIYILKIAELDCCQIIILSIYVPSTHAYTHVLRLSLDLPYETR
jgi:hypothetical protein